MTAAEQQNAWGVSVETDGATVTVEVGGQRSKPLTPKQAQRFAFYLARAYADSAYLTRSRRGNLVIGGVR